MPDPSLSWIIIALLVLLSFFFSASETAFACCNRFKIKVKAEEGSKTAKTLIKILDKYDRALTVVLIGHNIVAIAMSAIATVLFYGYFNGVLSDSVISLVTSIIMAFIVYLFGDTFPKTVARAIPDTLSMIFTYPIYVLMIIFFPITWLFEGMVKLTEKLFKLKNEEDITEEDLETVIEKASEEEMIDEDQAEIVQSTMDYLDTNVKEVLTPRNKMFALNLKDLTNDKLQEIICSTNYSRIPVYDKVFDNIVGILLVKIYFEEYEKDPHLSIRSILEKPYFVSPRIMIDDLFNGFKKHRTHIAIVRDDHKKVVGMVTMEDILEEIVSDISEPASQKRRRA